MPDDDIIEGLFRYRKKRNQKSKSIRRSDHKHEYERCIVSGIIGWRWAEACRICGRIKFGNSVAFNTSCAGLRYPEKENSVGYCQDDFYTLEELRKKFPGTKVFAFKHPTPPYDFSYMELEWDESNREEI